MKTMRWQCRVAIVSPCRASASISAVLRPCTPRQSRALNAADLSARADIPRIFSRFWRSDASRERARGGLGVGLAITKEIIDQHNGTITIESEVGKGTTFTLRIPQDRGRKTLAEVIQDS